MGRGVSDNASKRYILDTHRARCPEETLKIVQPFLRDMGITRIANLTGLDRVGLPTVMVCRPNSRSVAVSLGKGLSLAAAQVSGVMEAIESWHAEQILLPQVQARYTDLSSRAHVVSVTALPRVTGGQFDPDASMLWVAGHDHNANQPCWVPLEMVDTDYTQTTRSAQRAFPRTTNGLASGNTLTEATCHAICELIERDATTLWHHRPAEDRLDPASVDDARCRQAMGMLVDAGLEFGLWDTTSDIGIASFRCMISESGSRSGHIGIGDGCHPDRAIALLRAVTEAAQTRLTYISGARDDLDPAEFTDQAQSERGAYVQNMIQRAQPVRLFSDCPSHTTDSFEQDLDLLLNSLEARGMSQVVTLDLSRSDYDIAVVRAVVPGLEAPHDDPDYLPGPRARSLTKEAI